jgi:hypothetical protein
VDVSRLAQEAQLVATPSNATSEVPSVQATIKKIIHQTALLLIAGNARV